MPYLLKPDIESDIPPAFLTEALDDAGSGVADPALWDKVEASARDEVDGTLGQRFPVPFEAPIPPVVRHAMRVLVLERLYLRRGLSGDSNPWAAQAAKIREKLTRIANGEEPLTPEINRAKPSVTAITEPSKSSSSTGSLLA